ncbi:MAG: GIY-YIG nuclease family protein [Patescibacteria group bacterium]
MHYVYLLQSKKDGKLYIGSTDDLKRRIVEHSSGRVISTKNRRPLDLVYYEAYRFKKSALTREKNLKEFGSAYKGLVKRLGE